MKKSIASRVIFDLVFVIPFSIAVAIGGYFVIQKNPDFVALFPWFVLGGYALDYTLYRKTRKENEKNLDSLMQKYFIKKKLKKLLQEIEDKKANGL